MPAKLEPLSRPFRSSDLEIHQPTYNHTGVEPVSPNETHGGKNIMSEPPLTEVNMGDEGIPSGPHPGIRSLASADEDLPD